MVDIVDGVTREIERLQDHEKDLETVVRLLKERLARVTTKYNRAAAALAKLEDMGADNEQLEGQAAKRIARAGRKPVHQR